MVGKIRLTILLLATIPLFLPMSVNAESSVNIVSEGNSHATVKVNNSVKSSSISDSDVNTSVRIESNGEVLEYESDEAESVHLESSDGNSVIDINNGDEVKQTITPATKSADQAEKDAEADKNEGQSKEDKNIIEVIMDFFKNLFSFGE